MWSHSHRGSRCLSAHFTPSTCHPWCHMFERVFVVSSCLSLYCFSHTSTFSLSQPTCSLSGTPASMSSPPRVKTTALTHNEEYCPVAIYSPLTTERQERCSRGNAESHSILTELRKRFSMSYCNAFWTFASWSAMVSSDTHTWSWSTHPVDCIQNRSQFVDSHGSQMSWPVTDDGFGRSTWLQQILHLPCSCPSSQPPILSITAMAHENSVFAWIEVSKSKSSSTKDVQNCLTAYSLVDLPSPRAPSPTQFYVWPNSSCLFVKGRFLFFPFLYRLDALCTLFQPAALEASAKTFFWPPKQNTSCGDACRVSHAHKDDPRGRWHPQ